MDQLDHMNVDVDQYPIKIEDFDELNQGDSTTELTGEQHQSLIEYLTNRLQKGNRKRTDRLARYAKIDQSVSTWQRLNPEDTKRQANEDATGRLQALPINMPLIQAHLDDAVAFFTEVFAPVGGQFFAMPGKRDQTAIVKTLTDKMEEDMKQSAYYAAVAATMRTLTKYNFGGFALSWEKKSRLNEKNGNVLTALDVYNFLYDPSIREANKIHEKAEWAAMVEIVNKVWLIRNAEREGFQNLENVFGQKNHEGQKMNAFQPGKAVYYKHPPNQTRIEDDGSDGRTGRDGAESEIDWDSYGLGLAEDKPADIDGHELITMFCWIVPEQFDLDRTNEDSMLELWRFRIVDSTWIVAAEIVDGAIEIPCYTTRLNQDEMGEATRSLAEHLRPFQRFISFLLNTHVEGIRKNVWGMGVYDPTAIDISAFKAGQTSGWAPSKMAGRDVRTILSKADTSPDTYQNVQTAGEFMNLMKQLFPNQAMPSQIAGMDRAVSSQVSAVLQGSMRKMHMLVRVMDSLLMLPVRMGMYRNIAAFDENKSDLRGITPEQVANLLGGGLGQINREAAAEQIRTIIFALIQNPEGNEGYDVPGLFQLWSMLMNIGTDLSEFIRQPPPTAGTPGGLNPDGSAAPPPEDAAAAAAAQAAAATPTGV